MTYCVKTGRRKNDHPQITPITQIHFRTVGLIVFSERNLRNRRNLWMIVIRVTAVVVFDFCARLMK
jgi:hypothetical protein